jgi:alpha-L-fucosidase
LLADLRARQPQILVNNRLYEGLENKNGDYGTPEKYVPPTGLPGMDWEVNHTLNESYGYSAHDQNWKDTKTVVQLLCDIVSKGGNLLLNIGPDAHGRVPEPAQRALRGVGAWMKRHGEAIYGTTASPFPRLPWGCATRRGDTLYLLVFDWPRDGVLQVPLRNHVRSAQVLGREAAVAVRADEVGGGLSLTVGSEPADAACSVVRLSIDGNPDALPFAVRADAAGVFTLSPNDAELHGPSLRVERVGAIGDVRYNLGFWLDAAAFATWPLLVPAAGEYRVVAEFACKDEAAGAQLALQGGTTVLEHTVAGTGGWQSYREFEIGTVRLSAGRAELALRARSRPGEAVVNVRALRLLPR